ncbi:N-methylhydantoinase A [Sphingobium faniae]|nr:N-methylhydantoinase A [Sphingobium faniae]
MGTTRIGADIGGTFTDVAAVDSEGRLYIGKRLTTHGAEHEGVIQAVRDTGVDLSAPDTILAHGTTLVINALLERKGAKVALVTTEGFADLLDIGRGNRSEIFTLRFRREGPLVPREMRFEIAERTYGDDTVTCVPTDGELDRIADRLRSAGAEAVAVSFLNSYLNPANELHVAAYLAQALGVPVTASASLSRQWREYERFTTGTANAYIAPVFDRYLQQLIGGIAEDGFKGEFVVLDSSGGAMAVDTAKRFPVRAVESGPVGGVIGARTLAGTLDIDNLVTLDIGGTTAKSALVERGEYATTDLYWIGGEKRGFPLQVSTVDIIEISVGGGSIASIDATGGLQVGPHSAGSKPGPVCYGLGGTRPTLTDANLYCGRIDKDHFAGNFTLDVEGARRAIEGLAAEAGMSPERLALGILRLANMRVASTVRRQTLERGYDPRSFTLLASGGAGPLHACEVAAEVGIDRVLIPRFPGHYSALGMLGANLRLDRTEVVLGGLDELDPAYVRDILGTIAKELTSELTFKGAEDPAGIFFQYALAIRFRGQEHALWIAAPASGLDVPDDLAAQLRASFEEEYVRRYGHLDKMSKLETVELKVVAERVLPPVDISYARIEEGERTEHEALWGGGESVTVAVIARSTLKAGDEFEGPAVIHEIGSTTSVPPRARVKVLEGDAILIDVSKVR